MAIVCNSGFLHWVARRSGRVLLIDGEMPREEMKRRLIEAAGRLGCSIPAGLSILSREDAENMPPLNTKPGQKWLDAFIAAKGPFDFIVFDNLQALLVGELKEEQAWADVQSYVLDLTKRHIGQLGLHHTGIDESRGYGSKMKKWQLDLVAEGDEDLAFSLKFTKARLRTPETRADFESVGIALRDGEWLLGATKQKLKKKEQPNGNNDRITFEALIKALLKDGKLPPVCNDIPDNTPCVSFELWRACIFNALPLDEVKRKNETVKRCSEYLIGNGFVGHWNGLVWKIKG